MLALTPIVRPVERQHCVAFLHKANHDRRYLKLIYNMNLFPHDDTNYLHHEPVSTETQCQCLCSRLLFQEVNKLKAENELVEKRDSGLKSYDVSKSSHLLNDYECNILQAKHLWDLTPMLCPTRESMAVFVYNSIIYVSNKYTHYFLSHCLNPLFYKL